MLLDYQWRCWYHTCILASLIFSASISNISLAYSYTYIYGSSGEIFIRRKLLFLSQLNISIEVVMILSPIWILSVFDTSKWMQGISLSSNYILHPIMLGVKDCMLWMQTELGLVLCDFLICSIWTSAFSCRIVLLKFTQTFWVEGWMCMCATVWLYEC